MEESVETLNKRLVDTYGLDSDTGRAIFRIVWSTDQFENRLMDVTDGGIQLLHPAVREVRKYPFFRDFYILERLVLIPEINKKDLPTSKMSYEPIWVYRNVKNEPLPPHWDVTKIVVDVLYAALGKKSLRKYVEDVSEDKAKRITEIEAELFGNETDVGDALAYKEGVTVPNNYEKEEK